MDKKMNLSLLKVFTEISEWRNDYSINLKISYFKNR